MKKKVVVALLCAVLLISFVACDMQLGGLVGELFSSSDLPADVQPLPEESWGTELQTVIGGENMPDPPIDDPIAIYPSEYFSHPNIRVLYSTDTLLLQDTEAWNEEYCLLEEQLLASYRDLDIEIDFTYTEMSSSSMMEQAYNAALSGATENTLYYFPLTHFMQSYYTYVQYMYNLNDLPDYKPYDDGINHVYGAQATVGNKQYSTVGGMTPLARFEVDCLAYNPAVAEELGLDLYDLVQNGEWTWSSMLEICEMTVCDLNGDTVLDKQDRYAFSVYADELQDFLMNNSGEQLSFREQPSDYELNYIRDISNLDMKLLLSQSFTGENVADAVFAEHGNIMLRPTTLSKLAGLRGSKLHDFGTFTCGVLPAPKYSAETEAYAASAIRKSAIFSVGLTCEAVPMGNLLTNLEYLFARELTPRLEEQVIYKISSTEQDAQMARLIIDSTTYDLDRIMLEDFGRYINLMYDDRWPSNDYDWCIEQYEEMYRYMTEEVLDQLENIH